MTQNMPRRIGWPKPMECWDSGFSNIAAAQQALRAKFQEIPVAPGLKEQIISERTIRRPAWQRYWGLLLATAAAAVVLISVEFNPWFAGAPSNNHTEYLRSMTETAQATYAMLLETNDSVKIRAFLAKNNAPADYVLPEKLQNVEIAGCTICFWQGSLVSIIGFKTGGALPAGMKSDLWFLAAPRSAVAGSPPVGKLVFQRLNSIATASWTDDKQTYVLATAGSEELLKKYVP